MERLNASTYPPLATDDEIAAFEAALGHHIDPLHREFLARFGRVAIGSDIQSLTTPDWETVNLQIGDVSDSMFWVRELPEEYDLHGYTPFGSDYTGMQVIYGPFPDPRVYVFDRFDGSQQRLERIGDNIEHTIQRLQVPEPYE